MNTRVAKSLGRARVGGRRRHPLCLAVRSYSVRSAAKPITGHLCQVVVETGNHAFGNVGKPLPLAHGARP